MSMLVLICVPKTYLTAGTLQQDSIVLNDRRLRWLDLAMRFRVSWSWKIMAAEGLVSIPASYQGMFTLAQ